MVGLIGVFKGLVPKGLKDRLWPCYIRQFGHTDYQRFAIIGHARTGSNFLHAGLNTSESIRMYHEIFAAHKREIGKDYDKVLSTTFRKQGEHTRAVGFKLFYYHLTDEEWERFLSRRDLRVIHLTRRNRLRTIVSLDLAVQTNRWSTKEAPEEKSSTVRLDPDELIQRIERIERYEESMRARLTGHSTLEVVYESMVADPVTTFESVSAFLGVGDTDPAKISIRKQNPQPLDRLIENYDEVAERLRPTRFAGCL